MKMAVLLAALAVVGSVAFGEIRPIEVKGAPFALTVNEWTPPARDFPIVDYGAKADGRPVTEAIEKAVAAAAAAGGGRVVVPAGEWLTGGFDLRSDVALVVSEGATLRFPDDPVVVYRAPLRANGRPQPTRAGLIQAIGCTNVAVLGTGTLKADVDYWHRNFMMNPQKGFPRPQFFTVRNCRYVRFEGFKIRGSPAWTMHFTVCEDIVLRNVDSVCTGPNTDGLDLESCNRALVEGVSLDQTDDTYTIKSGFNEAGRRRNIPTQNVVIRNCRAVHGHSMLGIGSEVSGGIRNIYMTDCTIESECWNWLFVKTNAKRGAFVENVTMENVCGRRAGQAVMNVEMFYDGNPNKELDKKVSNEFVTAISGITARNIVCEEAGCGVKVRGDASKPPRGLKAENIRIGRLRFGRTSPTDVRDAADVEIRDVRVDPSAVREINGLPDAVRPYDPSRDGVGAPRFDLAAFDDLSDNAALGRVLRARIAAETRTGRNVAPRIEPVDASLLPEGFEGNHRKDLCIGLAALGCAIPGALVADDVRAVAEVGADGTSAAFPGLKLTVVPDLVRGTVTVTLANGGGRELRDLWGVLHLPLHHMTRRQTFCAASVPAGGRFVRTFEIGAGAHYLPRPVGTSAYAAEADFTADGTRARLWSVAEVPVRPKVVFPVSAAMCAGPMDVEGTDDTTLAALSAAKGPLTQLDGAEWRSPSFEGAAWYDVTGPARPYTERERRLVLAGRAVEVVALQFEAPEFAKAMLRLLPYLWDRKVAVFLNGERIKVTSKVTDLPAKVGLNRLVVRFASKPGANKACAQLAVYPWGVTDQLNCVPFEGVVAKAPVQATGAVRFPLEWNVNYDTSVPYEVELSREKLAKLLGARADTGFDVRAKTAHGVEKLPVTLLPARDDKAVRLRFAVPKGTLRLGCAATGTRTVSDPERLPDNLFAGATSDPARWQTTPRMRATVHPEGGLLFSATDWGSPEATLEAAVPPALAGKGVVFEAESMNVGAEAASRVMRLEQYDAAGKLIAESVVDRRWTGHTCPPGFRLHYLEEGRLHLDAAKVRLYVKVASFPREHDYYGLRRTEKDRNDKSRLARHRLMRLSLRPAATLPFPKYDDAFFAAGVSGESGDTALRLGGTNEKAFWYQTRSNASWSDKVQLRDESLVFFPSGEGTVEAWFRSPWRKPAAGSYTLFQAYQGFRASEVRGGKGSLILLSYAPDPGTLTLFFREPTSKDSWTGKKDVKLPADAWCHVALQWTPKGEAEVFVDGRRVLTLAIPKWIGCNLKDESVKVPNDENAQEFFLGCSCQGARLKKSVPDEWPLLEGAVDLFRASTGRRYGGDFTPAKKLSSDAATRALFTFDRSFDGVSGGGLAYIPGTIRALSDRVDHVLAADGRTVQYWPQMPLAGNDPRCVFDIVNYPVLPKPEDFEALRRPFAKTATLRPGETLTVEAPSGTVTDYVEIENVSAAPLVLPALLNEGDVDARSFGDLSDSLGLKGLPPRERADRVFQLVLSAADYFQIHSAMFPVGSDRPRDVEYDSFTMINGYCGFECGPMNHLTANLFAVVAGCPASETAGYGHQFEQVFYDGKNHIYDLSAQKFFPAWDNETAAYLKEAGDQPGMFCRYDMSGDHFIRMGNRAFWGFTPKDVPKVGVTLNPGERFRVWQVNDGNCNDLISDSKGGLYHGWRSKWQRDMDEETHADTEKQFIQRVERFFPHYLNGFLTFRGRPDLANPAFAKAGEGAFTYAVRSGYPITRAAYSATRKDGSAAKIEFSTDGGKTYRPFVSPATYAVRARFGYFVKVLAPIGEIAAFEAETEVQLNPRVFPGRLRDGRNVYTLKAVSGERAKVTVAGRSPAGRLTVRGRAAYSGTVRGVERLFTAFDSAKACTLELGGISPAATVASQGNVVATLAKGTLTLRAKDPAATAFGAAIVSDGGAEREIAALCGPGVRYATADDATVSGVRATIREADETSPQRRVWFSGDCRDGSAATFRFDPVKAGRYAVFNLNRFVSHPEASAPDDLRMIWKGQPRPSYGCGSPRNNSCNFLKANYGRPGERANFKWDYPYRDGGWGLYQSLMLVDVPAAGEVKLFSWRKDPVEVAALLVVPEPSTELRAELIKFLCGLNADPWRIAAAAALDTRCENMVK